MIKAQVTTYACDQCGKEQVVWNDEDFARFEAEWFTSIKIDICPDCRQSPRGIARIQIDMRETARLAADLKI